MHFYMQVHLNVIRVVISLGFCGMMPNSSGILLQNMVEKVNKIMCDVIVKVVFGMLVEQGKVI